MMLSVMVVGAGAAFTDQDKIVNTEAVDVCVALNIINGFEDGSYRPEGDITRAEACKMICIALNGGKVPVLGTNDVPTFTDIDGHWAEAYIEYCVSEGIVAGVGDGKFDPNGKVTASQFAKMLLIALGYNANHEKFTGSAWDVNVNVKASDKNLYEGIETIEVNAPLTRDNAAQMLWNALQAYIVEYTSTLITNSKGELVAQYVVGDKVVGVNSAGEPQYRTLLGEEYVGDVGYTYLKSYSYDDAKGIWTYTFDADTNVFGGNDINNNDKMSGTIKSDVDYTDFFGQKIKVVYKTDVNDVIYGIYAYDSEIVAEAATGQVDHKIDSTNNTATVDGQDIRFDNVSTVPVFNWNNPTALFGYSGMSAVATDTKAFVFKLVDNNTDGKVDAVLRIPVNVAKILYTGAETVTFGTPLSFTQNEKDITIYDGYAKNDWVAQVPGSNAVTQGMNTYEKMDVQTGTIEGIKTVDGEKNYLIDGTWYTNGTDASGTEVNLVTLNNNDTIEFVSVGNRFFHTKIAESGLTGKDIVMVINVGMTAADTIEGNSLKAKLLFSDDSTEIVGLSKVDGAVVNSVSDSQQTVGHLFTYRIDSDGDYELTRVGENGVAGYTGTDNLAGYDKAGSTAAYSKEKIGGYELADDAIVFVLTNGTQGTAATSNKGKVYSGREIKNNYTTGSLGTAQTSGYTSALIGTVDGFEYARVAVLNEKPTINTGSNYGYITSAYTKVEDSDTYRYFNIWTENGELTVKEKSTNDLNADGLVPGMIMTYDVKDDSEDVMVVKNVSVPTTTTAAITGWSEGNGKIQFNDGTSNKITDDTVVIYVDSKKKLGAEGGSINESNKLNDSGTLRENNVRYICGSDAAYVDLLVVDVNNKMQAAPAAVSATAGSATAANALLNSTDATDVTADVSGVTTATTISVPAGKTLTLSDASSGSAKLTINVADGATLDASALTGSKAPASSNFEVVAEAGATVIMPNGPLFGGSSAPMSITAGSVKGTVGSSGMEYAAGSSAATIQVNKNVVIGNTDKINLANITLVGASAGVKVTIQTAANVTNGTFYATAGTAPTTGTTTTPGTAATTATLANNDVYAWGTIYTDTNGTTSNGWVKQ